MRFTTAAAAARAGRRKSVDCSQNLTFISAFCCIRDKCSNICSVGFIAARFRREIAHSTKALAEHENNNSKSSKSRARKVESVSKASTHTHTYLHASRELVFQGEECPNESNKKTTAVSCENQMRKGRKKNIKNRCMLFHLRLQTLYHCNVFFCDGMEKKTHSRKLLTTNCCELGECMVSCSCFSSWSRFGNEAEHCEHAYDPSTDILGLMELPLLSSLISSLMLLDECVDVGVCCARCFIKKSTGIFSLSPDKPDTNDGTKWHTKRETEIKKYKTHSWNWEEREREQAINTHAYNYYKRSSCWRQFIVFKRNSRSFSVD